VCALIELGCCSSRLRRLLVRSRSTERCGKVAMLHKLQANVDECATLLGQMLDATGVASELNAKTLCQSLVKYVRLKVLLYGRHLNVILCLKKFLQTRCSVACYYIRIPTMGRVAS